MDRVAGVTFKESWPTPKDLQLGMDIQSKLQRLETNIAQRRREFEGTHRNPKRLRELRDLIARDQREIVRLHLADALENAEAELQGLLEAMEKGTRRITKTALKRTEGLIDRMRSLLDYMESTDFALVQKPFLWPIAFPEVLREGDSNAGFDIVLANPPYVRMEKLDNEDELTYGEAFAEVSASRADVIVYFYARALQILRPGGWLSFITSNSFTKRKYGTKLRGYLPNVLTIERIIDFGEVKIFDAAVEPYVLIGHKTPPELARTLFGHNLYAPLTRALGGRGNVERVREEIQGLPEYLETEASLFPQSRLTDSEWRIEDERTTLLFERLMNQGMPLGEFVNDRVYMGVKTGLNSAFVIDQAKRDELIEEDSRSREIIKPWLRGRDVERWKAQSSGLYIIFVSRGVDINQYPAIEAHLRWFQADLEKRATSHTHRWYDLQQPQEGIYHEFAHPKIVWPDIAREVRFAYDNTGSFLDMTCFMLSTKSKWLLPLLNSDLHEFLLCQITNSLPGGFLRPKRQWITRLPIVSPDEDTQAELETLANEILSLGESPEKVEGIEREIDALVFHAMAYRLPNASSSSIGWVNAKRHWERICPRTGESSTHYGRRRERGEGRSTRMN